MAAFDNSYSRFIAFAKIVLPLAALGLLSTLFLFSPRGDEIRTIPYSKVDLDQLAREQRITAPNYASVTEDGTAISVSARFAQPGKDAQDPATAGTVAARLEFSSGTFADITATTGAIDAVAKQVTLTDGVRIVTSDGYRIETRALTTALDRTEVVADSLIEAETPMGKLTAGTMRLTGGTDAQGDYVLVFKHGVKLVYQPQS